MVQFNTIAEHDYKEAVASLDIADLTGDGIEDIVITTTDGSLRILNYTEEEGFQEINRLEGLPPISTLGHGKVLGGKSYEFVLGHLDNTLRIVAYLDNELEIGSSTPLGSSPTSICVLNVVGDTSAEVIVSTNDKALRCYGWFDVALDKLAHKVIDNPAYTMKPLHSIGVQYSRFVFGDDDGYVYIYQYADDRLHERAKAKAKGNVHLLTSGRVTGNTTDDVVTASDGKNVTLFCYQHPDLKRVDSLRAPSAVTSLRIGSFLENSKDEQILVSHDNSSLALLGYEGNRLYHLGAIKTQKKSIESHVAFGDLVGDSKSEIVQVVGKKLYLLNIE
jgi:hypothetical protein